MNPRARRTPGDAHRTSRSFESTRHGSVESRSGPKRTTRSKCSATRSARSVARTISSRRSGCALQEGREQRRDAPPGIRRRQREPERAAERAAHVADELVGFAQQREDGLAALEVGPARRGQAESARRALDQSDAEARLERRELPAHGRLRAAQPSRGRRDAPRPHHGHERLRIPGVGHCPISHTPCA